MIKVVRYGTDELSKVLERSQLEYTDLNQKVAQIVERVKAEGDAALYDYTAKFDGVDLNADTVLVSEKEIDQAYQQVSAELLESMRKAMQNIVSYQTRMYAAAANGQGMQNGTGYVLRPMDRAGLYVPGGKAAYPSSVMMTALAAKVAGVKDIIMTTPVGRGLNPLILVLARECGISKIFKVGGAQAIAAMAFGTESIPKCSTVIGPGNVFVTLAKKYVYGNVGVDMIAGPSEILIVADQTANPVYLAADMLSQAEHDELASSFLITADKKLAEEVKAELETQLNKLTRKDIASKSLADHSAIILVDDLAQALEICNTIAPEHLELCVAEPDQVLKGVRNAGAVFMGHYSPEPLGDYFAGPSHVLPTSGAAKFSSALSVDYFLKKISVIQYNHDQLIDVADDIIRLAETEGFTAHANSIKVRKEN